MRDAVLPVDISERRLDLLRSLSAAKSSATDSRLDILRPGVGRGCTLSSSATVSATDRDRAGPLDLSLSASLTSDNFDKRDMRFEALRS